ncbi:hypothetical protein O9929_08285 [Vibrio lentus]|nr:hypothetical protein [Vibrio lentus]
MALSPPYYLFILQPYSLRVWGGTNVSTSRGIRRKRDNEVLTTEEINFFIKASLKTRFLKAKSFCISQWLSFLMK